jgi:hypothetical protein
MLDAFGQFTVGPDLAVIDIDELAGAAGVESPGPILFII